MSGALGTEDEVHQLRSDLHVDCRSRNEVLQLPAVCVRSDGVAVTEFPVPDGRTSKERVDFRRTLASQGEIFVVQRFHFEDGCLFLAWYCHGGYRRTQQVGQVQHREHAMRIELERAA